LLLLAAVVALEIIILEAEGLEVIGHLFQENLLAVEHLLNLH
jgi:hypothetical protein